MRARWPLPGAATSRRRAGLGLVDAPGPLTGAPLTPGVGRAVGALVAKGYLPLVRRALPPGPQFNIRRLHDGVFSIPPVVSWQPGGFVLHCATNSVRAILSVLTADPYPT
jgi:hypothetical protein